MLLPRYRQDQPQPRRITDKLREITARDTQPITDIAPSLELVDTRLLRGIPCIAPTVSGTQPGTNPLTELLRNDHRRRYI